MRTTVTLDDDVVALLRAAARDRRASFKEVLNAAIRAGLTRGAREPLPAPTIAARPMGARPGLDLDRARHLAAEAEDEEILRKIDIGK